MINFEIPKLITNINLRILSPVPPCNDLIEKLLVAGDGSLPPRLFSRVALHLQTKMAPNLKRGHFLT
jgi:hypothetical protein